VVSRSCSCFWTFTIRVGEERPARAEARPERRVHLGRVDAYRNDPRVGDLRVFLQSKEAAEERLLLGAPPAPVELQHGGIAAYELGEPASVTGVVEQLELGELPAHGELADDI
jgi:hypothetical protein